VGWYKVHNCALDKTKTRSSWHSTPINQMK
jgi:hypothetical protein